MSHSLLVLWRQGKRSLSPELEIRYHQLVTTGRGEGGKIVSGGARSRIKRCVYGVLFYIVRYGIRTSRPVNRDRFVANVVSGDRWCLEVR